MNSRRASLGFTLIELIVVMIMLGVLAVVVFPKMDSAMSFRAVEFRDQTIAALRFAQKTAVSHRRLVCVAFASASVTLTIDHDKSGACDGKALLLPGSNTNVVQGTDSRAVFASTPASLFFQPNGQATDAAGNLMTLTASIDAMAVYVAGATGYVGDAP